MKHWIKLALQPLCVLTILSAPPPPRCHCATAGLPRHARRPLNFYCLSITLYMRASLHCPPGQHCPPSPAEQTTAQQGAFTPICHRLSPFVLTDNRMSPSPTSATAAESHLVRVTRGTGHVSASHGSFLNIALCVFAPPVA